MGYYATWGLNLKRNFLFWSFCFQQIIFLFIIKILFVYYNISSLYIKYISVFMYQNEFWKKGSIDQDFFLFLDFNKLSGLNFDFFFFKYSKIFNFFNIELSNGLTYSFNLSFGVDGISISFVFLTVFLIWICFLLSFNLDLRGLELYLVMLILLEVCLILSFVSLDIFFFYIFFEIILIPMFFLISIWGSRSRKVLASYFFFIYTAIGSIFILVAIILLIFEYGTTDLIYLWHMDLPLKKQKLVWIFLFFGFAVKVPMFPVHLWLPEAHVEAPTGGSIILAGILLKLGGYGFLRFLIPLTYKVNDLYIPLVYTFATISIMYCSLIIMRQLDIKKIIAYSSIIHMNMGILGLFSLISSGVVGSLLLLIGHGFISSALFLLIGVIYKRYGTRLIYYYGGLSTKMPLFTAFFFFFTLANISFPGTVNFVGEFLICLGIFEYSFLGLFLNSFFVMFFGTFYSFWLFNRVAFGELKNRYISFFYDLDFFEFFSLFLLLIFTLYLGIKPAFFFSIIEFPVHFILIRLI